MATTLLDGDGTRLTLMAGPFLPNAWQMLPLRDHVWRQEFGEV